MALYCSDRRIRVLHFQTGKLRRVYDESLAVSMQSLPYSAPVNDHQGIKHILTQAAQELQRSGAEMFHLEDMDFGRRLAVEKELEPTLVSQTIMKFV